jgi:hypothetical protein
MDLPLKIMGWSSMYLELEAESVMVYGYCTSISLGLLKKIMKPCRLSPVRAYVYAFYPVPAITP